MVISSILDFSYRSRSSSHHQMFTSQWAKGYRICFKGVLYLSAIGHINMDRLWKFFSATTISSNDDRPQKAGGMSSMNSTVWCKRKNSSLCYSESASHPSISLEIKHQPQTQLIPWLSTAKPDTSGIRPSRQFDQEGKEPQDQIREVKHSGTF